MVPGAHEMAAPWGIDFKLPSVKEMKAHAESLGMEPPLGKPPRHRGSIIAVIHGSCCLEVPEHRVKKQLSSGDVVLIISQASFTLKDDWKSPSKSLVQLLRREHLETLSGIRSGGDGAKTTFFTGGFIAEHDDDSPLLAALPPAIHIRGSDPAYAPWMDSTLKFLNTELALRSPGFISVANHLAHVLFIQAVRTYAMTLPEDSAGNWFQALFEPDLADALGLMHLKPEEQWTVSSLAEAVGAGRSKFAARFMAAVGQPPMQYLTDCRMRKARQMLRDTDMGIKTIAVRVGYSNESAFGNAFKRSVGVSPGAYREQVSDEVVC
jgi:AraC-like DNA-binding protein